MSLTYSSHHQTSKIINLNIEYGIGDVGEQSNPWLPWCRRVVDRVWTVRGWKCRILEYGHSIHIRHDWSISGKRVHNREPECHESTPEPYCTAACCVIFRGYWLVHITYCTRLWLGIMINSFWCLSSCTNGKAMVTAYPLQFYTQKSNIIVK